MNEFDDSDELLDDFIKSHYILSTGLVQREIPAIYWTLRARREITSALSSRVEGLITEPTWGLLSSMLDRVFEHVEGSIIAFVTGSPASAEVIARTVVESSLNVMYILKDDRINRLFQYFSYYINQERKELKRWSVLAIKMEKKEAHIHNLHIEQKRQALDTIETFVKNANEQIGIKIVNGVWPKTIEERFKLLGFEVDYRTVYAAMCSQTHNDAEDLLNYFIFVSSGNKELLERGGIETVNFSRLLMYIGVHYYIEATHSYAKSFGLDDAIPILIKGKDAIAEIQLEIILEKYKN